MWSHKLWPTLDLGNCSVTPNVLICDLPALRQGKWHSLFYFLQQNLCPNRMMKRKIVIHIQNPKEVIRTQLRMQCHLRLALSLSAPFSHPPRDRLFQRHHPPDDHDHHEWIVHLDGSPNLINLHKLVMTFVRWPWLLKDPRCPFLRFYAWEEV